MIVNVCKINVMPLQHTDAIDDNTDNINVNYNRIETIVPLRTIFMQFLLQLTQQLQ